MAPCLAGEALARGIFIAQHQGRIEHFAARRNGGDVPKPVAANGVHLPPVFVAEPFSGVLTMEGSLVAVTKLPTKWGEFALHVFTFGEEHHLALVLGDLTQAGPVLTRIHSECLTGDALFSQRCDCGSQLASALQAISREGRGLLIYLRQEGRGIGLLNKLKAYQLQDGGLDTVDANLALGLEVDSRSYEYCRFMFNHFGIQSIRLITNNPKKLAAIAAMGIAVERLPSESSVVADNERYIATKIERMGHLF